MFVKLQFLAIILWSMTFTGVRAEERRDSSHSNLSDRALLIRSCCSCHPLTSYIPSDRSPKDWELTIERMRIYAESTESKYTDADAVRMVHFLSHYPKGEALNLDADPEPSASNVPVPETTQGKVTETVGTPPSVQPIPETVTQSVVKSVSAKTRKTLIPISRPHWIFSVARILGDIALGILVMLVFSALLRKHLGRSFHFIHVSSAFVLVITGMAHSVVFTFKHGFPNILWYWFGLIAMVVIMTAVAGGFLRLHWQGRWFKFHKAAALVGTLLVLLHWIWFYLR